MIGTNCAVIPINDFFSPEQNQQTDPSHRLLIKYFLIKYQYRRFSSHTIYRYYIFREALRARNGAKNQRTYISTYIYGER